MKIKCKACGTEVEFDNNVPFCCPKCKHNQWDAKDEALRYAEKIGIYEYEVNGTWIEYWSFFPGEGFRFIRHNLADGYENRDVLIPWVMTDNYYPIPAFLKDEYGATSYNYNCG